MNDIPLTCEALWELRDNIVLNIVRDYRDVTEVEDDAKPRNNLDGNKDARI